MFKFFIEFREYKTYFTENIVIIAVINYKIFPWYVDSTRYLQKKLS